MSTVLHKASSDGKIVRACSVRVVRDGIVIHEGSLASLKRFKDDAKEVVQLYVVDFEASVARPPRERVLPSPR